MKSKTFSRKAVGFDGSKVEAKGMDFEGFGWEDDDGGVCFLVCSSS